MKKTILVSILLFSVTLLLQAEERIAILPFTGLTVDEGIFLADTIGGDFAKAGNYRIVLRTLAINAALKEQDIQRKGFTDSATISELGKGADAQYVVSGHVQKLGNKKLISTSIIDVETFQQISGDYVEYENLNEVVEYLPLLAQILLSKMDTRYQNLPTLAIIPFEASTEASANDRDVLAQLLAINLANSGKYAVITRTDSLAPVIKELNIQSSGLTDGTMVAKIGKAINADYVLYGKVVNFGGSGYINVNIINVETFDLEVGERMPYKTIGDAITILPKISYEMTGVELYQNYSINMRLLIYELQTRKYDDLDSMFGITQLLNMGVDFTDDGSPTALMYAAANGYTDLVKRLIAAAADVNIQNGRGETALMLVSVTDIAKRLIAAGADVNIKDEDGNTALMWVLSSGDECTEIVKALIAAAADVNIKNRDGNTALMFAGERWNIDVVKALIAAGADVNIKDEDGNTALMLASGYGQADIEIVKLLIEAGADVNIKSNDGYTALMWASWSGDTDIVRLLKAVGARE